MSLKIVQISDTHLSDHAPLRTKDLANCVSAINQLPEPPDLVVHTGDIAHDGKASEYHTAKLHLNELSAPYFVMAGNRDSRATLLDTFADRRYQLPDQGWVQYAVEYPSCRLLMVDTVSERSNKGELCKGRLDHLEAMLLFDTTKPVTLFLHHPPFKAVGIPDPYQYADWNDVANLTELLTRFSNFSGMYCGHVHRMIDGDIAGLQASALPCLAGDLRKGEVTDAERKLPVFKVLSLIG